MLVLGIGSYGRDSAVALFDETSILSALEEEKLSRSAGMGGIPRQAILRCLEQAGARVSDLTLAGIAHRPGAAWSREAYFRLGLTISNPRAADWTRAFGRNIRELTQLRQLQRFLGEGVPTSNFEHHISHAASAFYTSDFDRALILTLDENGDMWSGLISTGQGDEISPIEILHFPNSLGWFYSRVTELLGMRPHRDEHKLQWLSKEGRPEYLAAFSKLFKRDVRGLPVLQRRYFARGPDDRGTFSAQFHRELGIEPGSIVSSATVRADLARSAQDVLENIVLEIAERFRVKTGSNFLCVAGGVFSNVFLVRALETRSQFQGVHVQPIAGNSGTALAAAFLARKQVSGTPGRKHLCHLYLGPEFSSTQIKAVLDNCKIIYKYMPGEEQLLSETVQLLLRDKTVAWFQGRVEFGHRALGNRSILASPFSEYVGENIDQYVKHREAFHPFAISVPAEVAPELFDCTPNCRFMASLGTLKERVPGLERFAFGERQLRVHTVERESNPRFWSLLHKFGERAPAPVLVNTSFNLFGEPLVCDPRDAIRSFYCAGIDALAIGGFLVIK
jgi:carbamoyltransferase